MLALASSAIAQERQKRTFRVIFPEGPDAAPQTLHIFDGSGSREVELPRMNFSPVYELPAGNLHLTFLTSPIDDPEQVPAGAPTARVPENLLDFYLIVASDPANPVVPVSVRVVNVGADRLRAGQMFWFNLTDHQVGGQLGTERLAMRPQSTTIVDPPATGADDYPVNLSYVIEGRDHLYPICETRWRHDPRSRSLAFVFTKPGSRTPRVLVFPDFRSGKAAGESD